MTDGLCRHLGFERSCPAQEELCDTTCAAQHGGLPGEPTLECKVLALVVGVFGLISPRPLSQSSRGLKSAFVGLACAIPLCRIVPRLLRSELGRFTTSRDHNSRLAISHESSM